MNLTRREALRGTSAAVVGIAAAGAVAATVPAIAKTHPGAILPAADDEQLFALCDQFEMLAKAMQAKGLEYRNVQYAAEEACPLEQPWCWDSDPEIMKAKRKAFNAYMRKTGVRALGREYQGLYSQVLPLSVRLLRTPARTPQGIARKLVLARYAEDEDLDAGWLAQYEIDGTMAAVIDSVTADLLRLAGGAS